MRMLSFKLIRDWSLLDIISSKSANVKYDAQGGIFRSSHSEKCTMLEAFANPRRIVRRTIALNYERTDFDGI